MKKITKKQLGVLVSLGVLFGIFAIVVAILEYNGAELPGLKYFAVAAIMVIGVALLLMQGYRKHWSVFIGIACVLLEILLGIFDIVFP